MAAFVRSRDDVVADPDPDALLVTVDPSGYVVEWQIETSDRSSASSPERRSALVAALNPTGHRER